MLFVQIMKAANDNEELSFITLSAATANVTRYLGLNEKKDEQSESDSEAGRSDQQRGDSHRKYVDQRLKELAAFERRVSGNKN